MKAFASLVLLTVLSACSWPAKGDVPDTYGKSKTLLIVNESGGLCGASFVAQDVLLTATHCLKEGQSFNVSTSNGTTYHVAKEDILVRVDDKADHLLLKLNMAFPRELVSSIRRDPPKETERLTIWGHPGSLTWTFRPVTVAREGDRGWLVDCTCFMGDSGSPFFDKQGRIVGIMSSGYAHTQFGEGHLFQLQFGMVFRWAFTQEQLNQIF